MTTPIGIPYGTRLVHIERVSNGWRCWTGVNSLALPQHQRRGTFLYLADNGSVSKTTINPDASEDVMLIKGPDQ